MIRGIDTYIVQPRDTADYGLLVDALGATPRMTDLHVVIGLLSPCAPSDRCNGLMLPVAAFDQIYAFDTETLVTGLPKPDRVDEEPFRTAAADLFERVVQLADNTGSTDTHRALNYLAVRRRLTMADEKTERTGTEHSRTHPRTLRVRLPGFVDDEIGLGDVVKRVTHVAVPRTCTGCDRRAAALNRWVVFSGRKRP